MTTTKGSKGSHGTNGSHPGPGGTGQDENFTQNGAIGLDTMSNAYVGGDGGNGGNANPGGNGGAGGNGGNGSVTLGGNIFNNPATTTLDVSLTGQGGDGGTGGTGVVVGAQGNGGNGTVNMNGNILQPNKNMSTVNLEAISVGGHGSKDGNASATLNGNVIQVSTASNVTLAAEALSNNPNDSTLHDGDSNFGTKSATLNGNVVQGNITTVMVQADAKYSNGTATITGNIVQDSATSGSVTLEATAQHLDIENNKLTVGKNQDLDFTVNSLSPAYDTTIKGNEFTGGSGTGTFVFTDNGISGTNTPTPSATPDVVVIDLSNNSFMFNGKNNKLKNFDNVTVAGNNDPTIIGNNNANTLTGGNSDDTISGLGGNDHLNGSGGNDFLTGGAGNDVIDGGAGTHDTADYSGTHTQYTISTSSTPDLAITVTDTVAARDGMDTLKNVEYLHFSDGYLWDVANNTFVPPTGVNHEPMGTNNTVTMLEDNAHTFSVAEFGFSDPNDAPANNFLSVEITTLPTLGTLTDNGVAVTVGQFVTVADIAANKLVFTPTTNANGSASFTFQVKDDGGVAGGGQDTDQSPNTMGLTITSVNDAPAGTNNTVTMLEDNSHTFSLAEFGFTDPNDSPANNFLSVEITTLPTLGVLKDNGVAVTVGQFVTAADIAANKLVFTPNTNINGSSSFTFQVKDDGGVTNGGQDTDQSPNTMGLTITSVNDEPAGTNNTLNLTLNTPHTFTVAEFGFTDPNDSPANNFLSVEITTLPGAGSLTDNGVPVVAGQFVTVADIAANKLVFTPGIGGNGPGYGTFTFQVKDDGGVANGGQDTDQSANTMAINVGSVNHAPAGTNNTVTMLEDNAHTFSVAEFGFSDAGDTPANNFLSVEITTLPTLGSLTNNGVAVTAGQFVTVADIAANKLVFTPTANANGGSSFTFQVKDDGGVAGGGQDTDQSPNTMGLTITSVNDAPAGTNNTITMLEDNSHTFSLAEFGFTDPNDSPANNFLSVEITTLPTLGVLKDNGVAVTVGQFVTAADIAANKLVFTPTTNANGSSSFTFQVKDDGGVANSGQDTDQSPNTMGLTITSVNDAPMGADNTITTLEDNAYTFTASDFGLTDPNDSPANNLAAVEITTLPGNGVLKDNGVAVTVGQFVSAADIAANKLVFTPTANVNGSTLFTFQVQDDGGVANGGQDTDQTANTMTVNITSVNDAPAGTSNNVSMLEDNAHTFSLAEFGFTDPSDTPANNFQAVKITTLPTLGVLTDNGVAVTVGQFVSAADIVANNLVFTPNANANGNASFTFQVQDDGGVANGGQDTDQTPNTMGLTITAVNDEPAGTNNTVNLFEDGAHTFSLAEFGFSDPNDSPANNLLAVEITTLPLNGSLTDNGVAVTSGQFISAADIAANLLVFTPNANFNGNSTFAFQVQDDGGVANGGQDTDQSANLMTLNVTSVNDAPVGTDNTITMASNTAHVFTAGEFGFTDPSDTPANNLQAVEITSLPGNGSLTDNGNPVTVGQFVTIGDINAGLLQYAPGNAGGAGYGNFTFKVQDDGGVANGGQDTDTTPRTMAVNVNPGLIVGTQPGDFATIQAAINAANPGDTILIRAGVYHENVTVNKAGLTLQALSGPGTVTLEGGFSNANGFGNADGTQSGLATWLKTAPNYIDASDNGFTISADNVTLNNITVNDFYTGVIVSGPSVSGLSLNGVTMQSSVIGFSKPDDTALNGLTINGSTFTDGYIGAGFFNDTGATGGAGFGQDATDTSILNSNFSNIDTKGVYMETAQGNTLLDGDTMNNVGQYGSIPSFGADGKNGNGFDINLKYHDYTGANLTISNFHLTDTGLSNGGAIPTPVGASNQAGAIVVEGRDDPSGYNTIPADVSGMTVNIQDGIIDGTTSTGIRAGENKANPAQNDTGPAVTVNNVTITGATVSQVDNHTNSLMIVNGTTGNDTIKSGPFVGSTGSVNIFGLGGDDILEGGLGDDVLNGGSGNDTLIATAGSDTLNGGANNDTADFSGATNGITLSLGITSFQNLGDFGQTKITNVENLIGTGFADVLTGETGNNTLQGMGGDDRLVATTGKDTLDGGAGNDTADFSGFAANLTVSANAAGFQTFDGTNQVKLISIENLIGGTGDDTLTGNSSNNILIGGAGNDVLKGNGGTLDIYNGGAGDDTITGTNAATTDVAYFSGQGSAYTITGSLGANNVHVAGPDAITFDTLNRVDRVKFLSPSHVSDTDNNGASDLIFQNSGTGTITTVNNPGGATNTLSASPASNWRAVGTGMFNPDAAGATARKAGILLQNTAVGAGNGDMEVITGISGTTSTTTALSSPTGTFAGLTAITAADFNGDAASDILMWNAGTQSAEVVFLNQGVGETVGTVDAITTITGSPTGGSWAPIAAGDFNGDGKSDIVWQNGVGGAVEVTLMNGATITNTDTVVLNTAPGMKAVGTGDFDNDGKSDLLFSTGGPGSAAEIWTMNGDTLTNSFDLNAPTTGASGAGTFTLMGAEDVNGDGYSDLLWQNTANGDVVATEMTAGNNVLSTVNMGAPASPFHLVASTGGG